MRGGGGGAGDGMEFYTLATFSCNRSNYTHTHTHTHTHTQHTHTMHIIYNFHFHNFMLLCDLQMWSRSAKQDELVMLSKCYHHAQSEIYLFTGFHANQRAALQYFGLISPGCCLQMQKFRYPLLNIMTFGLLPKVWPFPTGLSQFTQHCVGNTHL